MKPINFPSKQPSEVEALPPETVARLPTKERERDITDSVVAGQRKAS